MLLLVLRKYSFPQSLIIGSLVRITTYRGHWLTHETRNRTLISIPVGSALQQGLGSQIMVLFLIGVRGIALVTNSIARSACLRYAWKWNVKV